MRFSPIKKTDYGTRKVVIRFALFPKWCDDLQKFAWLEKVNELLEFKLVATRSGSALRGGIHTYWTDEWVKIHRTSKEKDVLEYEKEEKERQRLQRRKDGVMNLAEFKEYISKKVEK